MSSEAIQIVTTTAEKQDADALVEALLETRLAACVQITGPIESSYWWNGRIQQSREWMLAIKTRRDLYPQVERLLLDNHPYDEPEILAVPVVEISSGYLAWLNEQVRPKDG